MYIVQYTRRSSCFSLGLGLAVGISSVGLYIIQLRMNEVVALAVVRVSSGVDFFPVLECIPTVRKKDFVFLARVRVSSQYFPILDCISYSCARKRSWLTLAGRERGRERDGGREGERGVEAEREGGSEGGREGERDGGREGERGRQ